jgi:hypothetical protein
VNCTKPCNATAADAIRPGLKASVLLLFILGWTSFVAAQRGGERIFEFVQLPTSARSTALGGSQIAALTNDYGLVGGNPAMLNPEMDRTFIFQHNFYFDGIDNGYAGYAKFFPELKSMIHAGVHYASYGKFVATDEMGNIQGEFKASDLSIQAGISKVLNERMSGGILLQYIQSSLESYTSNGLLIDAGLTYKSEDGLNHYALVLRSMGFQFSTYYEGDTPGKMPVDLQFGFSKRLQHVPFRLSVLIHDINRWDLRYTSPLDVNTTLGFGEDMPKEQSNFSEGVDNFFRHFVFGGEILIGKKETVMLRFAYNHQRAQELSVVNLRSLAGFSGGIGINFKAFVLDYGFAVYHQAGSSKHLGIRVPLSSMKGKSMVD